MFRFTIRDVLWLMVVVAMGVAWWLDHRSLAPDAHFYRTEQAILKTWTLPVTVSP